MDNPHEQDDLDFEIPEDLLNRHLGGDAEAEDTTEDEETPEPAATEETDESDDHDDEHAEDEALDDEDADEADDEDAGDDEPEDTDDEAESEEESEDEDDEEDADTEAEDEAETGDDLIDGLPKFDRDKLEKQIKDNPELGKAYRHLQALATRKTQAAATTLKEAEQQAKDYTAYMERIRTPEGRVEFVAQIATEDPTTVGAAFEKALSGEQGQELLVSIGLANAKLFEAAYNRVADLMEDPSERSRHDRDVEMRARERRLEERDNRARQDAVDRRIAEIRQTTLDLADKAKLTDPDLELVAERVIARAGRQGDISDKEVAEIVDSVAAVVRKREEEIRQKLSAEQRKAERTKTKERARQPKRGAAPRGSSPKPAAPRKNAMREVPEGVDPLDHAIDLAVSRLG
jgi:hypothetical protein